MANTLRELDAESLKAIVKEEAYRKITVGDGDREVEMPLVQAAVRRLGLNALKGQLGALRKLLELLLSVEGEDKVMTDAKFQVALAYKTQWEHELERRKRCGEVGREPVPHPDNIVIDLEAGTVEIWGPITDNEKADWDEARAFKVEHDAFLAELEAEVAKSPEDKDLQDTLAHHRGINASLAKALGE